MSEQARKSATFVSLLLSSLLGALLAPAPIPSFASPQAPATTGIASAAANLPTPAGIAFASNESDEDGTSAGDPPVVTTVIAGIVPALEAAAVAEPLEPRLRATLSSGHGFSARAPPLA